MTLDEFFAGHEDSRPIFEALRSAIDDLGPVEIRDTKSQVAFCREKVFAWAWTPDRYLHGKHAPLVLTLSFRYRDASPRWKGGVLSIIWSYTPLPTSTTKFAPGCAQPGMQPPR